MCGSQALKGPDNSLHTLLHPEAAEIGSHRLLGTYISTNIGYQGTDGCYGDYRACREATWPG